MFKTLLRQFELALDDEYEAVIKEGGQIHFFTILN